MQATAIHAHPIVLIRSGHSGFSAFEETVAPYLAQMGFTYDTVDTSVCPAEEASAAGLWRWPLVILALPGAKRCWTPGGKARASLRSGKGWTHGRARPATS